MIKRLMGCIGRYKKESLLAPFFVTLEVVLEVVIPMLMATLIDKGVEAGNMSAIVRTGLYLIIACVFSLAFGALSGRYAALASAGFARNLRERMFHNVQDFSFSNIDKFSTASIVTRLTTDVSNVQNAYQMIIRIAVRGPMMLFFALFMAFSMNRELSLIFLGVIPFLGVGLYIIMVKAHPIFERVFKTYDKLNRVVQENLHGIRVVKSFVREDHEIQKFEEVSQGIYKDFTKAERILAFNSPLMQTSLYACILLVSWLGAKLIVGGSMTTGQLMSLITYSSQILMSLMMLSMVLVMTIIARTSAERVVELLGEKSDIVSPQNAVMRVADGSVIFEDVSFSYYGRDDKLCLKNADFGIASGETIGIVGGTGSAKSTLVQLIPRLYDATKGRILVGGVDVRDYDLHTLRNAVAMVLQKNQLFSGTIKDNLRWGNEHATDQELKEACVLACADGFINEFTDGYDMQVSQGGTNVSGGQKQRLCIARALLKKPKILILDDSTSAVDTETDAMIRKGLRQYLPETTKIIIAQRISSVEDADRIIVLENGSVNGIGTHDELLENNAVYREVYELQMKGGDFDGE
ncbi:MAG: ABC transporter ATP-binding protein [Clostridiaceae bacterium]|nr:ABC transporter ATP-binding protein [Clostridiaceae bacterium]